MAATTEGMDTTDKLRELIQAQLGSQILALCEAHAQIAVLQAQLAEKKPELADYVARDDVNEKAGEREP